MMDLPKIPPVPGTPGTSAPLTQEQLADIQTSEQRLKKIRRAVGVARTDAAITGFFGVTAILSFCLGWEGPVLGVALCLIAFNSYRCARKLNKLDLQAPMLLAMNQVYLAAAIILYALYELYAGLSSGGGGSLKSLEEAGMDTTDIKGLMQKVVIILYTTLIGGTILAQGLTALYYASRKKFVQAYLDGTPQWLIDLQRGGRGFPVGFASGVPLAAPVRPGVPKRPA